MTAVTAQRGGRQRAAEEDPRPVGRREQEPLPDPVLEVARDSEPREHAAERGRLEQHERELEGRVAGLVVETGHLARSGRARPRRR